MTAGFLMLLPALCVLAAVFLIPLIHVILLSFSDIGYAGRGISFAGLSHYRYLLSGETGARFREALGHTVIYALIRVTADLLLALLIAALLDLDLPFRRFFRTAFLMPLIIPAAVSGLVFLWLYDPHSGPLNQILTSVGLPVCRWLYGENTALISVILFSVWRNLGVNLLVFSAGLHTIPKTLPEAARLDGCSESALFFRVKLPLLRPYLFFAAVIDLIGSLRTFTDVNILTPHSGPLRSTMLAVTYITDLAFKEGRFGRAAACAVLLFLMCRVIYGIRQLHIDRRRILPL